MRSLGVARDDKRRTQNDKSVSVISTNVERSLHALRLLEMTTEVNQKARRSLDYARADKKGNRDDNAQGDFSTTVEMTEGMGEMTKGGAKKRKNHEITR